MKWALDSENMRVNADEFYFLDISPQTLRLPCCMSPAIYVQGSEYTSRAYFRHSSKSNCPYAISTEYNLNLHWEIIDSLEDLSLNSHKWRRFLWVKSPIPWWIKLGLSFHHEFQREVIIPYKKIIKRTDVKYGNYVFEIQCSYMHDDEMNLREKVYRSHGLRILWIMGIPPEKETQTQIRFPYEAAKFIQKKFRKQLRLNRRFLLNSKHNSYEYRGIALEKWRVHLIQSQRIFAIFFQGQFYTKFHIFTMLSHIPKIQFEHACRKVDILYLSDLKER